MSSFVLSFSDLSTTSFSTGLRSQMYPQKGLESVPILIIAVQTPLKFFGLLSDTLQLLIPFLVS